MSKWTREYEKILLRRVSKGDREAFGEIYDRYAAPLFSFAIRILKSRSDSEEVVQDVLHSLWKQAGQFNSRRAKLFTWLTAMTRNRCIDRLRARGARIVTSENFNSENEIAPTENISAAENSDAVELLIQKEESEQLKMALMELPQEQKTVLELAFLAGWTHTEIAEKTSISLGTVKARIRYGLEKLRNRYTRS